MDSYLDALNIPLISFPWIIVLLNIIFCIAWTFDSKTHDKNISPDISSHEFQTHRLILIPSILMEISLVTMYWKPWISLPFFLGFYFVRTVYEFIDELKFHTERCTPKESYLHLTMWCSVHIKTICLFIWGFFFGFNGVESLPIFLYLVFFITLGILGFITMVEFKRK